MTDQRKERRQFKVEYQGKFFVFGVIIGALIGFIGQDYFSQYNIFPEKSAVNAYLKQETEEKLLDYIDGEWSSSIGDVKLEIANIGEERHKFLLLEMSSPNKEGRKFRILKITQIEGFFGVVKMNVCEIENGCDKNNIIPIQINKIFGMQDTIVISYDSRLTFCVDDTHLCSRAFKRIE